MKKKHSRLIGIVSVGACYIAGAFIAAVSLGEQVGTVDLSTTGKFDSGFTVAKMPPIEEGWITYHDGNTSFTVRVSGSSIKGHVFLLSDEEAVERLNARTPVIEIAKGTVIQIQDDSEPTTNERKGGKGK